MSEICPCFSGLSKSAPVRIRLKKARCAFIFPYLKFFPGVGPHQYLQFPSFFDPAFDFVDFSFHGSEAQFKSVGDNLMIEILLEE